MLGHFTSGGFSELCNLQPITYQTWARPQKSGPSKTARNYCSGVSKMQLEDGLMAQTTNYLSVHLFGYKPDSQRFAFRDE
jgi:hypothetical protein